MHTYKNNFLKGIMSILFLLCFFESSSQKIDSSAWNIDLEDIVVTAQFAPTHSSNALHKIRTIDVKTFQNRGIADLENLLQHELNIRISQDMILGSSINLQGMSGQNIKVMIDGVPVIGRVGDNIDLSQISLHNIERVEIIEGPLSVNYGTNALGGVINLISKKSQLKKYDFKLNSTYESTSEKLLNLGLGIRLHPRFLTRIEGSFSDFDGFNSFDIEDEEKKRTFQWNPKVKKNLSGLLRYNFGSDGKVIFKSGYFKEDIENLGPKKRLVFKPYAFDEYYKTDRFDNSIFIESTLLKSYYLNTTIANNYFKRQKEVVRFDFEENLIENIPNEQDTSVFDAWVFRPVLASKFEKSKINFQVGFDFNYEQGFSRRIKDDSFEKKDYSAIGDYAIFASIKYHPLKQLDLQIGLRKAKNTKFKTPLIPSLNIKYKLTDRLILRTSYAIGFRAPTLKELFLYFVDSNHFIIGNSDLKPELSDNHQIGLDWNILKRKNINLSFSTLAFYNDIEDKIDLYDFVEIDGELVPAAKVGKSTTDFAYFNQERFKSMGMNFALKFLTNNIKAEFGFAPIGRYNISSVEIDNIDPFSYVLESNADLSYTFPKQKLSFHFYIKHNNKLIRYYVDYDENEVAFTNQTELEGYFMADFNIVKKFWKDKIQLNLGVKNIFDIKNINYSESSNNVNTFESQSPVAKGRKWHAGIIFNFNSN